MNKFMFDMETEGLDAFISHKLRVAHFKSGSLVECFVPRTKEIMWSYYRRNGKAFGTSIEITKNK